MTAIQVDPATIADALHIEVSDLADLLAEWSRDKLSDLSSGIDFERRTGGALTLEQFDAYVAQARTLFEDAHAAYREHSKSYFPAVGTIVHLVEAADGDDVRGDAVTVISVEPLTGILTVEHGDATEEIDNWFYPESDEA